MSRLKRDYETSRFRRFEKWVDGETAAPEFRMETRAPLKRIPPEELSGPRLNEEKIRAEVYDERHNRELKIFRVVNKFASVALCVTLIGVLLWTVMYLPEFGNPDNPTNNEVAARYIEKGVEETGATNFVTGMILDYRAFDTFGESCVLFIAATCVQVLMRLDNSDDREKMKKKQAEENDRIYEPKNDLILQKVSCVLVPLLFIFGIYIILNGHLSPGGGVSPAEPSSAPD